MLAGAPSGILGPMKRNLIGPCRGRQKNVMPFYIKLHFKDIFDYHSHIYEKNKKKRLYGCCDLIYWELCWVTQSAAGMFSSVRPAQEGESPKLLTKHSVVLIAELYYTQTHALFISELFLIHEKHSKNKYGL